MPACSRKRRTIASCQVQTNTDTGVQNSGDASQQVSKKKESEEEAKKKRNFFSYSYDSWDWVLIASFLSSQDKIQLSLTNKKRSQLANLLLIDHIFCAKAGLEMWDKYEKIQKLRFPDWNVYKYSHPGKLPRDLKILHINQYVVHSIFCHICFPSSLQEIHAIHFIIPLSTLKCCTSLRHLSIHTFKDPWEDEIRHPLPESLKSLYVHLFLPHVSELKRALSGSLSHLKIGSPGIFINTPNALPDSLEELNVMTVYGTFFPPKLKKFEVGRYAHFHINIPPSVEHFSSHLLLNQLEGFGPNLRHLTLRVDPPPESFYFFDVFFNPLLLCTNLVTLKIFLFASHLPSLKAIVSLRHITLDNIEFSEISTLTQNQFSDNLLELRLNGHFFYPDTFPCISQDWFKSKNLHENSKCFERKKLHF